MSLDIRFLGLGGVAEITPRKIGDHRGFFSETWNARDFRAAGIALDFVQDNHSRSTARGVLRGLHFQLPPHAQDKLVRVTRGAILDVAVDIRRESPTFAQWVAVEISSSAWNQLLIPKGFAHGFVTLQPDTEVIYKTSSYYAPDHDRAIRFDDTDIGIEWPLPHADMILSERDRHAPLLRQAEVFEWV